MPGTAPMFDDELVDDVVDEDRLTVCAYFRCGEIFERRNEQHRFCRKACRSRQKKWQRAQARRAKKQARSGA